MEKTTAKPMSLKSVAKLARSGLNLNEDQLIAVIDAKNFLARQALIRNRGEKSKKSN